MNTGQEFQIVVVKRLHPEAQAVDACGTVAFQFRTIDRPGIRFERDLCVRFHGKCLVQKFEQTADRLRSKQRRRSPAEEHCLESLILADSAIHRDLTPERAQKRVSRGERLYRVKIAVNAFVLAVGNMEEEAAQEYV